MTEDKNIEEMATIICQNTEFDTMWGECYQSAKALYNAGYRKASDVAEEIEKYILEEASKIESDNSDALFGAKFAIENVVLPILEAYKKKYTEGGE